MVIAELLLRVNRHGSSLSLEDASSRNAGRLSCIHQGCLVLTTLTVDNPLKPLIPRLIRIFRTTLG